MYKLGAAFKGDDISDFLKTLRAKSGKHKKLAVFWDNASIHKKPAREVAPGLKIEVIWNAPYRPDLNGIEFFWRRVKNAYRKEVTRLRVLD
jgi:transposase